MKARRTLERKAICFITILMLLVGLISGTIIYIAVDHGQSDKIALQLNERALREAADLNKRMVSAETAVKSIHALANQLVDSADDMKDPAARNAVKKAVNDVFSGMANDTASIASYYMTFDPDLIHARDGIFCSKDSEGRLQTNEITDIASFAPDDVEHIGWYTIPKAAGEPVWLDPYLNKNINRWLISYVIPFFKDGQLVAVIGVDFGFKEIVDDIDQVRFLENGYAFLKNADGTVHYHDGYFEGDVHGDEASKIPESEKQAFEAGETKENTVIYSFDGVKRVGVMTRLENGMVLSLVNSYAEVYHMRNVQLAGIILLVALLTLLAILVAYYAVRKVTIPIKQLTEATAKMENGDYDLDLPSQREDEIGILVEGTKLLAKTLQEQKAFNETAIAERNRRLEKAIIEAENANRAKTAFLSNMSHDIRTPMNAILGLSELAKKNIDDREKVTYFVDQIEVAGNQLLSLINGVLEISRIESNKIDIEEENTDTEEVYNGLRTIFDNQARAKNLTMHFSNEVKHRWIFMDRTHIEEILINLVSNAMKYTQDGGQIDVRFEELPGTDDGHVFIKTTVKDNGIGMSEEYQKKLFQTFERERNTTIGKIQGTGLGLSIVKKLVDLMGGNIEVNSVKGLGTSMTVTIPHRIGMETGTAVADTTDDEIIDLSGRRVLLAEDNDINALIVEALMTEHGIELDRAANGLECLDMLKEAPDDHYDLILMDIQMPVLDGYETTRAIRQLEDKMRAGIPIIAMTANAFREDRIQALNAGMNAHIAKPINVDHVMATLSRVLKYRNNYVKTAELAEFKETYLHLGCMCGCFVYRDDKDETIVYADAITEAIYGCETEEAFMKYVNGSFKAMVHPEDLPLVERNIREQVDGSRNGVANTIDHVSYRIIRKDGSIRKVKDVGYRTYNGKEVLFYVCIADVTDLEEGRA